MKRFLNGRTTPALLILVLLSSVFSGCLGSVGEDNITVKDMVGRKVKVPDDVERIVALGVGALRFVTYLGGSDRVVGIETSLKEDSNDQARTYMIAHPEYSDLQSVGPSHGGEPEKIEAVRPDVIFKTTYSEGDCGELQEELGIPVVALLGYCSWDDSPDLGENIDVLYEQIRLVGRVLDEEARGEALIKNVEDILSDVGSRTVDIPESEKMTCYVGGLPLEDPDSKVYTYSSIAMLEWIGAPNVITPDMLDGAEEGDVDRTLIPTLDPEVIFVHMSGGQSCQTDPKVIFSSNFSGWDRVEAVENGNVYTLLGHYKYGYNFDTMLADVYWAGKVLYPERFTDIDPVVKADEIFTLWVGSAIYDELDNSNGQEGFSKVSIK